MSEQKTSNFITMGAGIAIVFALVSWFSVTSNIPAETVAVNETETEEKVVHVHSTEAPEEVVEEIIVVADELVEKAQEAAVRNQVNQAMKKSEDTDIADAE
jgi:predicted dinucleotide-utilizing enzyme